VDDDSGDDAKNKPADKDLATKPENAKRPPVTVTITKDGRVLVASQDTAALDRLEQFVDEVAPPTQRYKIFKIKYAKVFDVYLNLKEYYEDEMKGDKEQILDWWGDVQESNKKKGSILSKRPPLRLIWDPASDTILVANASASQLAEIERLIDAYDQPAAEDAAMERVTQPIKIKYSRASTIATAVKEVFRDLLSSKDKEFDAKDGKGGTTSSGSGVTILSYSRNNNQNDQKKSAPLKVGFQGALSLGADDVSNIVLVSAQKEVFDGVVEMIRQLDEEAAPKTTVQVHRLSGSVRAEYLQKALDEAVGTAWLGNRPEPTGTNAQAEQQNNDRNRDRDRDGDRGDRRRGRDND
jgi:type II secretory pathway component GspD/PulD (secretin)